MLIVTVWWLNGLDGSALTGSHDYDSAPPFLAYPGLGRLLVLSLSMTGMLGFFALVPTRSAILAWFGERSLSTYLLHGLIVMVLVSAGMADSIPHWLLLPALAVATMLVAAFTAMFDGPMRRLFAPPAGTFTLNNLIPDWRRPH
jgi:fucose 4-O-acetylase-like acetyltransferase